MLSMEIRISARRRGEGGMGFRKTGLEGKWERKKQTGEEIESPGIESIMENDKKVPKVIRYERRIVSKARNDPSKVLEVFHVVPSNQNLQPW